MQILRDGQISYYPVPKKKIAWKQTRQIAWQIEYSVGPGGSYGK